MWRLFRSKSEKEILQKKFRHLIEASFSLSHSIRKAVDIITAETHEILEKIESLKSE
jgi:hypothetical protein